MGTPAPKRGPGRPPLPDDERRDRWLRAVCTAEELARYAEAARRSGVTLSEWIRRACEREAKRAK